MKRRCDTQQRVWVVVGLTSLVVLLGCTGIPEGDGGASADAGTASDASASVTCESPLQDCTFGLFFASCGTTAAPVLACSESAGRCKWFTGGCPAGYRASDCPVDNVCCHTKADGLWPVDAPGAFSSMAGGGLAK